MGQTEAVAHLVRDGGLIAVSPGRLPGRIPDTRFAVERRPMAPAPGIAIQLIVEHHVNAQVAREIRRRIGQRCAVFEERVQQTSRIGQVLDPRLGKHEPSHAGCAGDIYVIVRDLSPIMIEPRIGTAEQSIEVSERLGFRGVPAVFAQDVDPGLGPTDGGGGIPGGRGEPLGRHLSGGGEAVDAEAIDLPPDRPATLKGDPPAIQPPDSANCTKGRCTDLERKRGAIVRR